MVLSVLLAWPAAASAAKSPSPITRDLSFYASFDTSAQPTYARGSAVTKADYHAANGIVGQGIAIQSDPPRYTQVGNLDRDAGTLSFWVKPSVDLKTWISSGPATRDIFSAVAFALRAYTNSPGTRPVIFFMTGATLPGKDFQWDYNTTIPIGSIPASRWTHVALTWNRTSGQKAIYIDGKCVKTTTSRLIAPGDDGESFALGEGLPGDYDELAIWRRVLTPAEINLLAKKPAEAADALAAYAKDHARHDQTWVIYPSLVYMHYADSLVVPGQKLEIQIPLTNRTAQAQTGKITVAVKDVWDKTIGAPRTFDVSLAANAKKEFPVTLAVDQFGAFRAEVTVDVGGVTGMRDVTTFGCVPAENPPWDVFFGGHISQTGTMPEMARRLGFAGNRVANMTQFTWWTRMEPDKGKWEMLDSAAYQRYLDLGFTHLGQWFAAPYWAVTLPDGTHPPKAKGYPPGWVPTDMDALRQYIRRSLKQFPKIEQWEMWNEPWVSLFWEGTPSQYVNLCRVMYQEAKQQRPDITVYAQLHFEGPWSRDALKLGLLKYCDAVSYHFYSGPGDPQQALEPIEKLRKMMSQYTSRDIPLLNSEGGIVGTTSLHGLDFPELPPQNLRPAMNYRQTAESLVQSYVVTMAAGVRGWYYYFFQPVSPDEGMSAYDNYSTMEVTRSPKPMVIAHCMLAWQLDNGKFLEQLKTPADGLRAYQFQRADGGGVAVMWAEHGARATLNLPGDMKAIDLMGNPISDPHIIITQTPVYIRGATPQALAAALTSSEVVVSTREPQKSESASASHHIPQPKKMADYSLASELSPDKLMPLDLSHVANMSLEDDAAGDGKGWMDEGPYNDMRNLKPGRHVWLGVPFFICGKSVHDPNVLTLKGRTFPSGPAQAGPIEVNHKLRGLFFVHAANWTQPGGTVGEYIIHYTDGKEVKLPIVVGQNIGEWWDDQTAGEDSRTIAFKAADPIDPNRPYRFLRVWYWENTRPDAVVQSISVRSLSNEMTFTVVAVTAALQ